ncbi:jg15073 [Pararge aegeria aegeria]|uniref:Jg15073 protein n=1 Tax=Pararge aegeria aegeria TaxID=348720 RepID=A0A8S4QWL5_9NEOP|nr:jg15073 [Pararge aegeria aegeria]
MDHEDSCQSSSGEVLPPCSFLPLSTIVPMLCCVLESVVAGVTKGTLDLTSTPQIDGYRADHLRLSEANGDIGRGELQVYRAANQSWFPACISTLEDSTSLKLCSMLGYSLVLHII